MSSPPHLALPPPPHVHTHHNPPTRRLTTTTNRGPPPHHGSRRNRLQPSSPNPPKFAASWGNTGPRSSSERRRTPDSTLPSAGRSPNASTSGPARSLTRISQRRSATQEPRPPGQTASPPQPSSQPALEPPAHFDGCTNTSRGNAPPQSLSDSTSVCIPKGSLPRDTGTATRETGSTRPLGLKNSDIKVLSTIEARHLVPTVSASLPQTQRGFLPGRSTLAAVIQVDAEARRAAINSRRGRPGSHSIRHRSGFALDQPRRHKRSPRPTRHPKRGSQLRSCNSRQNTHLAPRRGHTRTTLSHRPPESHKAAP